jgi:glycosyltransferase involved in cell wall biosynthesis
VSVGHLSGRKGFQRVLRVLPGLLEEFPDLRFAIVGGPGAEGNNRPALERLAAQLNLAGRVIFAGPQPPDEVACWLNAADLFVLASDCEGSPNVVLEAMASGVPVVVGRVGEAERMVAAGAGLLVDDPNDEIELRARIAEGLRRQWDQVGIRASIQDRTWEAVAERVFEQWQLAIEQPAGEPVRGLHACEPSR